MNSWFTIFPIHQKIDIQTGDQLPGMVKFEQLLKPFMLDNPFLNLIKFWL
jgi:hypothetical protein